MEKKKYTKPSIDIVELTHSTPLLDASCMDCNDDFEGEGAFVPMPTDMHQA